jgi:molybdate transport system ATP-binding protein
VSAGARVRVRLARGAFRLEVDLAWEERVAVVFGPSGSGKSTLFEVLLGFHPRAALEVRLAGASLDDTGRGLHLAPERRGLGWVPQAPLLLPHLRVRENLRLGAARGGASGSRALARAVEVLEIGDLLGRRPHELSGGEQQRVAIARAVASAPRALLLDEPLASLDVALRARALRHLLRLRDELELAILYVTHDPDEALLVGERAIVLDAGAVVATGPPREVLWSRAVLPLAERLGIENAYDARVVEARAGTSLAETAGGLRLALPFPLAEGEPVCVGVRAEDVLLSADPPGRVSARNVIAARVERCEASGADALVHLDAREPLVAKVTADAAASLGLAPGVPVFAVVKAQAIRRLA